MTTELSLRSGFDGGAETMVRLVPELPTIDAAVDAAIKANVLAPAIAAQVNFGLSNAIRFSGLGSPRALTALAAACAAVGDDPAQARCLEGLGDIALTRSDMTQRGHGMRLHCLCFAAWATYSARPIASGA